MYPFAYMSNIEGEGRLEWYYHLDTFPGLLVFSIQLEHISSIVEVLTLFMASNHSRGLLYRGRVFEV